MPAGVHEAFVNVGGAKIRLLKGGTGAPLLVLHGTEGSLGWRRYTQALAEHFTVYLPSHPGFDGSERPVWLNRCSTWSASIPGFWKHKGWRAFASSAGSWAAGWPPK